MSLFMWRLQLGGGIDMNERMLQLQIDLSFQKEFYWGNSTVPCSEVLKRQRGVQPALRGDRGSLAEVMRFSG
jgi:hypothetical protein